MDLSLVLGVSLCKSSYITRLGNLENLSFNLRRHMQWYPGLACILTPF